MLRMLQFRCWPVELTEEYPVLDSRKADVERPLAFVAGGAVLCVDVVHRHFEHVVAADADAVNFHRFFFRGFRRASRLCQLRVAHEQILPRTHNLSNHPRVRVYHVHSEMTDIPPKRVGILTWYGKSSFRCFRRHSWRLYTST